MLYWGRQEKMHLNDCEDTLDNQICNIQMNFNHVIINFYCLEKHFLCFLLLYQYIARLKRKYLQLCKQVGTCGFGKKS